MSVGVRIIAAILLIAMLLAGQLAIDASRAWRNFDTATTQARLNLVSGALVTAAGRLAVERGLVNGMLAAPGKVTPAQNTQAVAAREAAEAALREALNALPATDAEALAPTARALDVARENARRALAGTDPVPSDWFATATARIDAVVALRRAVDARGMTSSTAGRLITIRDRLAEIAEFAGRERGMLNGMIAADSRATPARLYALGTLAGDIDGAWAVLSTSETGVDPGLREALGAARHAWSDEFGPARRAVIAAAEANAAWPVTAADWFAASSRAIDSVLRAQGVAGDTLASALASERTAMARTLSAAAVLLGLAIAVSAAVAMYLRAGVLRPLRGCIAALVSLAGGKLDLDLPAPRGRDEIARLMAATLSFRETARRARAMEAAQDELRLEAENARAKVIRDIGDTIEGVCEQAISGIGIMTGKLRLLADKLHGGAETIASGSGVVRAEAEAAQQVAGTATSSAVELTGAIREIAQQMERAATSTGVALARATQAQAMFTALSGSVDEIGEVVNLITRIAQRTNLLALNATIEAARAGQAGRGFAVVAGEVKSLAQETSLGTARIVQRIAAINASTREARGAVDGIADSVRELNMIAAGVAAAVEQQSAATAAIADSVARSGDSASRTAARIAEVAGEADTFEEASAHVARISQDVATGVRDLKGTLVRLMRSSVSELDRRGARRFPVRLDATLRHRDGVLAGQIVDLSMGGARFVAATNAAWTQEGGHELTAAGLPTREVTVIRVSGQLVQLAFVPGGEAEEAAMREALARIEARADMAA